MKRVISILLVMAVCFCLCACGNKESAEYTEAVRQARLWAADVEAYYTLLRNGSSNAIGLTAKKNNILEDMENLRFKYYMPLSEDEKEKFKECLHSYDLNAYIIFGKYISTGDIDNLF